MPVVFPLISQHKTQVDILEYLERKSKEPSKISHLLNSTIPARFARLTPSTLIQMLHGHVDCDCREASLVFGKFKHGDIHLTEDQTQVF